LIANTVKAATVLQNCDKEISEAAYEFGKHMGIAYQVS